MTAVPDAWDECAACGHDRDDHDGVGTRCETYIEWGKRCPCNAFGEAAS